MIGHVGGQVVKDEHLKEFLEAVEKLKAECDTREKARLFLAKSGYLDAKGNHRRKPHART